MIAAGSMGIVRVALISTLFVLPEGAGVKEIRVTVVRKANFVNRAQKGFFVRTIAVNLVLAAL